MFRDSLRRAGLPFSFLIPPDAAGKLFRPLYEKTKRRTPWSGSAFAHRDWAIGTFGPGILFLLQGRARTQRLVEPENPGGELELPLQPSVALVRDQIDVTEFPELQSPRES
jgi:hypothetical protein